MKSTKENRTKRRVPSLLLALVVSLLFHATLLITRHFQQPDSGKTADNEPIEITEAPPEPPVSKAPAKKVQPRVKTKDLQVAETEDAANRDVDPNTKYLSEHNQKAEKQTRAKLVDDFRKKTGTGLKTQNQENTPQIPLTGGEGGETSVAEQKPGEGQPTKTKAGETGVKRDWKTLSLKDLSVGGDGGATAASDDKLDEATGDRTILSTKEFKFFSYYQRIKELLRQYWKPNVERKLAKMYHTGKVVQEDELVTKILVLLDENGGIQKISRVSGSGVQDLDEAAVEAFQKAGPFPNPPRGMIDADGFVRIRWDFILTVEAAPRIQFSTVGGNAPVY